MKIVSVFFALAMAFAAAVAWTPPVSAQQSAPNPDRQIMVMISRPGEGVRSDTSYGTGDTSNANKRAARRIAQRFELALVDDWPMPVVGVDCFIMAVPGDRPPQRVADEVAADPQVAWTEPVHIYAAQAAGPPKGNDPLFPAQPAARQWQLAKLHHVATGSGVRVAVVDSGIDTDHPDLAGQVRVNRNFVAGRAMAAEQHGTGVAGVIAARAGNGIGVAGIAPGAKLLGLRACWQTPRNTLCDSFSLAKALYFAIDQRAPVINMSLSGPNDRLLRQLLKVAMNKGQTVVAAFDRSQSDGGFPASVPGVIAVSDSIGAGAGVYVAPGRGVPTTQPGGRWFLVNGSSYAAAHVSGLFALVRQGDSTLSPTLIAKKGFVDACATMAYAGLDCGCACSAGLGRALQRR